MEIILLDGSRFYECIMSFTVGKEILSHLLINGREMIGHDIVGAGVLQAGVLMKSVFECSTRIPLGLLIWSFNCLQSCCA